MNAAPRWIDTRLAMVRVSGCARAGEGWTSFLDKLKAADKHEPIRPSRRFGIMFCNITTKLRAARLTRRFHSAI